MTRENLDCTSDEIREQLQHIIGSDGFDASERNRRFLSYVVDETLAGRADHIKAYSVATSIFGRDQNFDPQTDPIIRIEASRLRRSLERYYLTAGKDDRILITVPRGSYVPTFEARTDSLPATNISYQPGAKTAPLVPAGSTVRMPLRQRHLAAGATAFAFIMLAWLAAAWFSGFPPFTQSTIDRRGPAIFVAPFEEDGDPSAVPSITRGFTREVIVGLTRFNGLFVFGPETSFRYAGSVDTQQIVADLDVDFVLTGGTTVSTDQFGVKVSLIDAKSGQYIWSEKFDGSLQASGVMKVRDEVANEVVRALAQPYGVIFSQKVRENEGKAPDSLTAYGCVLQFYQYWRTFSRDLYAPARDCLERVVAAEPDYAEALASLSLIYSDAYRFGFGGEAIADDPRSKALDLAKRAVDVAPGATRGYLALALAYWLLNDVEQSLEALKIGLALNPNDSEILADLGLRLCWRDRWDEGLPLLREAFERNPAQPSVYRLAFFLDHYLNGRYEEAIVEAKKVEAPNILFSYMALSLAHSRLGHKEEANAAISKILGFDPHYGDKVYADLEKRNLHPHLINAIVAGLREAGLPVDSNLTTQGSL